MRYSIVFSSHTGNTAQLAEVLRETLPQEDCVYFGAPDERALAAPMICVGFWTDKGTCDESTKNFLKTLICKSVFLFGTAGFGGNPLYFDKILDNAKDNLDASDSVAGSFMCQGKMPASVLDRYEKMLLDAVDSTRIKDMIDCFHNAATHPNQTDFEALRKEIRADLHKCQT